MLLGFLIRFIQFIGNDMNIWKDNFYMKVIFILICLLLLYLQVKWKE